MPIFVLRFVWIVSDPYFSQIFVTENHGHSVIKHLIKNCWSVNIIYLREEPKEINSLKGSQNLEKDLQNHIFKFTRQVPTLPPSSPPPPIQWMPLVWAKNAKCYFGNKNTLILNAQIKCCTFGWSWNNFQNCCNVLRLNSQFKIFHFCWGHHRSVINQVVLQQFVIATFLNYGTSLWYFFFFLYLFSTLHYALQ